MPRLRPRPVLLLALLVAACGRAPTPAATPLDELAAKPAEVSAKLDRAQRDQAQSLKRGEAEATGADAGTEPQR